MGRNMGSTPPPEAGEKATEVSEPADSHRVSPHAGHCALASPPARFGSVSFGLPDSLSLNRVKSSVQASVSVRACSSGSGLPTMGSDFTVRAGAIGSSPQPRASAADSGGLKRPAPARVNHPQALGDPRPPAVPTLPLRFGGGSPLAAGACSGGIQMSSGPSWDLATEITR